MYIDIAFNATSKEFQNNLDEVLERSAKGSVMPLIVGLDPTSSLSAIEIARKYNTFCYFGVHPLHIVDRTSGPSQMPASPSDAKLYPGPGLRGLLFEGGVLNDPQIIAIGECGLDYYRADNKKMQMEVFRHQLGLVNERNLPYFLHCRNAFDDFITCIGRVRGVVHSFDGTIEQALALIQMGFYIGINGCSLKTEENVGVVRTLPLDRILLETDSPYCLIRKSYYSSRFTTVIKARYNEPCHIRCIAEVIACIKGISVEEVEKTVYENTVRLFPDVLRYTEHWRRDGS